MLLKSHAPRERVSWNFKVTFYFLLTHVTLHVSVWVEMIASRSLSHFSMVTLHVSVWVEITAPDILADSWECHAPRERVSWNMDVFDTIIKNRVTLHVSVWVEISPWVHLPILTKSRSTWACELKFNLFNVKSKSSRHAPRERVSWNRQRLTLQFYFLSHAPRERVSWNAYIRRYDEEIMPSRSTWACELKFEF